MSELIDNRRQRIESLKTIIKKLHQGADPESVRQELVDIVRVADAGEVAAMEQEIIAEGISVQEIKSMCDLHAHVMQDVLREPLPDVPPGHPADTIRHENVAIRAACDRMTVAMDAVRAAAERHEFDIAAALLDWRQAVNDLMDVDKHYRRKEDLFFSVLERHGITGPSKVMWAVHDDARDRLKALDEALTAADATPEEFAEVANHVGDEALTIIRNMTSKEEDILLPMMMRTLTEEEWAEIWAQSPRYGWCLVEPREGYRPPQPIHREDAVELPRDRAITFPTGQLDFEQLRGIFAALPVDLTFVDADDRVRFFSEGERVFSRSKAILGRKVQHCHPPKSVDTVERIVADFRAGRHNVAEFWIEMRGTFVHIRYFAVRDDAGAYLGTLEVTQDLTRLRELQGERRLLQYDETPGETHA